ncbi:hypothetical protein ACLOJK_038307 [Asimina triloba]
MNGELVRFVGALKIAHDFETNQMKQKHKALQETVLRMGTEAIVFSADPNGCGSKWSTTKGQFSSCCKLEEETKMVEHGQMSLVLIVSLTTRFSKLRGKEKISKNKMLQDKLIKILLKRAEWKRWGGRDHLIVAHHPNSMLDARQKLGSAINTPPGLPSDKDRSLKGSSLFGMFALKERDVCSKGEA